MGELRIVEQFLHRAIACARYLAGHEQTLAFLGRPLGGPAFDQRHQLRIVPVAVRMGPETRVVDPLGMTRRARHVLECELAAGRDHDEPVARAHRTVVAPRRVEGILGELNLVDQQPDHAFHERHVDIPPLARSLAGKQGRADRAECLNRRHHVGQENADEPRAGHFRLLLEHRHLVSRRGLHDGRVGRILGGGPGLPEPGYGAVNDIGPDRPDLRMIESQARHHAGPGILHHHVTMLREIAHDGPALVRLQVDSEAVLAAIEVAIDHAFAVTNGNGAPVLFPGRRLDLDDLRPQVGQLARAIGSGHHGREIQYPDAVEKTRHRDPASAARPADRAQPTCAGSGSCPRRSA